MRATAAAILLAATLGLAACTAGSPAAPAIDSTTGTEIPQTETDAFTLTVGQCFNDTSDSASREVTEVPVVDCAEEHDFEVYDDFALGGQNYPGDAQITARADAQCGASFESFVGVPADESQYAYSYFAPTEASWRESGDRLVSCLIGIPNGKTSGSLAGAAK